MGRSTVLERVNVLMYELYSSVGSYLYKRIAGHDQLVFGIVLQRTHPRRRLPLEALVDFRLVEEEAAHLPPSIKSDGWCFGS